MTREEAKSELVGLRPFVSEKANMAIDIALEAIEVKEKLDYIAKPHWERVRAGGMGGGIETRCSNCGFDFNYDWFPKVCPGCNEPMRNGVATPKWYRQLSSNIRYDILLEFIDKEGDNNATS